MDGNLARQATVGDSATHATRLRDSSKQRGGALEAITTREDDAWAAVLASVVEHDFHHLAGYHRLAERRGEGTAELFVYRDGEYLVALPLLLRAVDDQDPAGPQDATSVYGYAGPVSSHDDLPREVIAGFQAGLREELVSRGVVDVFSRLHPLIEQRHIVKGLGDTVVCGPTVSIDLTLPLDDQWAGYSKGTRRLIRRALEAGVVCVHDVSLDYLADFSAMYRATMERVGAPPSYFFGDAYFEGMAAELGSVLQLFVALVDGKPAAGGLFTACDGIVQAHLGASRSEYSALSPVRVIDDSARRWAVEAGARVLHLGGGVGSQQDSLFQYKAGFSDRRHEFSVWRWVVDEAAYEELCRMRGLSYEPRTTGGREYFPAYRQPRDPSQ